MCERKKCIYMSGHTLGICDYLSKTGHSKVAQIAKTLQLPSDSEEVLTIAQGKMCPFYRKRGESEKPLQSVLAETKFRTVLKKKKKGETKKFVPKVSEAEAREIKKWYARGLSDRHIADRINVPEYKVRAWRDKNKLQSNFLKQREFDEKKALKLYEKGMTDVEIGKELGKSTTTIYNWRTRAGLDANRIKTKLLKEKQELRIRLYREGKSDREIAEQTGTTISTVRAWRQYHKLKANDQRQACRYDRTMMREYYMRGMNDSQIAAKLGCHSGTVGEWRKKEGLTKNRIRTKKRMSE